MATEQDLRKTIADALAIDVARVQSVNVNYDEQGEMQSVNISLRSAKAKAAASP